MVLLFSSWLYKPSAAAVGLLLGPAKDNGGAAGDGDDDEGDKEEEEGLFYFVE